MRKTIADHMQDILNERKSHTVWYGDLDVLHECANRCGMSERVVGERGKHPLNIISKVLNALDRSDKFSKRYMKHVGRPSRVFILKEEYRAD